MLERSEAAKYAVTVFHESYNDFDIYVEDSAEGYQKIFALLLSRALGGNITLERVFPLGSRNEVIAAAINESNQGDLSRPAVFLLDGDLYLLAGEFEELPKNVIVLPRYCIENFMIEEDVLVSVMDDESTDMNAEKLRHHFDYSGWLERSELLLRKLFIVFATAHKLRSGIPTVRRGYSCICANEHGDINPDKVDQICDEILEQLIGSFGHEQVAEVRKNIEVKIDQSKCFISTYVSAKDFSLPLLIRRIRKVTGTRAPNINLKTRFSRLCNTGALEEVASAILKIVAGRELPFEGYQ